MGSACREGGERSRADHEQQGKVSNKSSVFQRGSDGSLWSPRSDSHSQERAGSKIHLPQAKVLSLTCPSPHSGQVRNRDLGFLLACKEESQLRQSH